MRRAAGAVAAAAGGRRAGSYPAAPLPPLLQSRTQRRQGRRDDRVSLDVGGSLAPIAGVAAEAAESSTKRRAGVEGERAATAL